MMHVDSLGSRGDALRGRALACQERTEELKAKRAAALEDQWVPPPPDPRDAPVGEAGCALRPPGPTHRSLGVRTWRIA